MKLKKIIFRPEPGTIELKDISNYALIMVRERETIIGFLQCDSTGWGITNQAHGSQKYSYFASREGLMDAHPEYTYHVLNGPKAPGRINSSNEKTILASELKPDALILAKDSQGKLIGMVQLVHDKACRLHFTSGGCFADCNIENFTIDTGRTLWLVEDETEKGK
jgi:hypothetical protein